MLGEALKVYSGQELYSTDIVRRIQGRYPDAFRTSDVFRQIISQTEVCSVWLGVGTAETPTILTDKRHRWSLIENHEGKTISTVSFTIQTSDGQMSIDWRLNRDSGLPECKLQITNDEPFIFAYPDVSTPITIEQIEAGCPKVAEHWRDMRLDERIPLLDLRS